MTRATGTTFSYLFHMFSESRIPHAQFSSGVTLARKQKADGQRWPSTIQTDHRRPVPRLTVLVCRSCGRLYQASPQPCKSRMSSPCKCYTFHPLTVGTRTSAAIACILCRLSAAMPPQHSACDWQRLPPEAFPLAQWDGTSCTRLLSTCDGANLQSKKPYESETCHTAHTLC